ncbi:hypothetical protein [Epilithonimonas sp.]|uniref:hypothetical protein n=1 Tax=Epilithonimonas sp. TaxID=2894511 RepID=UPI002FDD0EF6
MSLIFFVAYRIIISETATEDKTWLGWLLEFLKIMTSLGFSLIFLGAMAICSLSIFLNLNQNIRNNFYYSLLTFVGLSSVFTLYWLIIIIAKNFIHKENPLIIFLIFCVIYVIFSAIEFKIFRKKIRSIN